jgi:ketosteroid isomerase-like protein
MNRLFPRRRAIDSPSQRKLGTTLFRSAVVLIAFAGCIPFGHHAEPILPLRTPARDSLLLLDLHRVDTLAARGLAATRAALFAPDIVYLRDGAPPVFGRDNVLAFLAANPPIEAPVTWQPLGGGISRDAMSGYTYGIAAYSATDKNALGLGRYIAFWNRPRGGPWKISAYVEAGSPAPTATTQPTVGTDIPVRSRQVTRDALVLTQADSDFAEAARMFGAAGAFSDAVAEDGVIFGGSEVVTGPRAVREYFDARRGVSLTWRPTFGVIAGSGDLGFTIGESVATSRGPSGAAGQRFGKYLTVWRKEQKGGWKFVVDGGNSRPSPVGQ